VLVALGCAVTSTTVPGGSGALSFSVSVSVPTFSCVRPFGIVPMTVASNL
jgi:hypothetical protein